MYRNTLLLMSLLMCGFAAGPATARVADQSFFTLWNMKLAGPQGSTLQRLPCRQARRLEVDLAQPQTTADNVESLRHYLGKRAVRRPQAPALVAALGGVGDSAYGTLYNFDDENGGDTLRTLPELPTVLAASPVVVAAAVAEPNALALLALGLVVGWRRTRRGRATALTPRFA